MNGELLLEWMTHVGEGRWGAFRSAVSELCGRDEVDPSELRGLRFTLSDLGHADFFVEGSRRWRVLRPAVAGISQDCSQLVGGRNRDLLDRLQLACETEGTRLVIDDLDFGLKRVCILGGRSAAKRVSTSLGIEHLENTGRKLAAQLPSVDEQVSAAPRFAEPINWSVRSWSFNHREWVPHRLNKTVREYANRFGARKYGLHVGGDVLVGVDRRVAMYSAAGLQGRRVVEYLPDSRALRVPWWAPLPETFSRATCLLAGNRPQLEDGTLTFTDVPADAAALLIVKLGQRHPNPGAGR